MPELPEVETMRRGVESVVGLRVDDLRRPPCGLRSIAFTPSAAVIRRRVLGRSITAVGRRGKRLLLVLDDAQTLVIEPRMTGLLLISDPPGPEHLRMRIELSDAQRRCQLLFWDRRGLGTVRLLRAAELDAVLGDQRLGPDALAVTADQLRQRLGHSRRQIKVALLDQRAVAGIGNLYASEILHTAGIDPRARCDALSGPQWSRLQQATWQVMREAILHEGSTLSDGTYRNALNDPGGYQNHHRVYDRAGRPCPRCDAAIVRRIVQGQRSTFFCPVCQKKSGLHRSLG